MVNTNDLRYVRTEAAIRSAFMDMVAKVPVSSVTVSAVCKQAGVSRNAFYLHHAGIAELYTTLVDELVDDIRAESLASSKRRSSTGADDAFYEAIVYSLARHEDLLRALLPSDDGSLAKRLSEGIGEAFVEAALHFGKHGGSFEHRLRCAYAAWAIIGFTSYWITQTDRPLTESLASYREINTGLVELAARYLLDKRQTQR